MSKSNMNLKLVTGLLVASGSTVAVASMNNLDVQSNLGEQFSGSIVVTGPTAQEILKSPSSISVSGAPVSARVSKQGSAAVIHLRSSVPINDPVLRLKVQAGSESRQYSAIIDPKNAVHQSAQVNSAKAIPHPPVLASNDQPASKPTAKPSNKASAPKPAQHTIQNNRPHTPTVAAPSNVAIAEQYKVQAKDNIFEIARRYQPDGLSTAQTVQALMRANPQAFRNHNPNLLYGDATLKIPSAEAMHQLAKGRSAKTVAATAAAATAAVATGNATAAPSSAETPADVAAIEKQLAELEQQKAQLEKQLAQAQQASAAAEATAPPVAASAAAASTPATVAASEPVVTQPQVAPPPAPPIPVPEEKGLMDLLIDNLPYLAGGLVVLLLLAMLIARSRKKAAAQQFADADDSNDDAVEIFNFDDAPLDAPKATLADADDAQNQLTAAELAALDSFNPQEEKAFHQTTAKPTAAPQADLLSKGATALVGGAAVTAAAHAASEQDFMPSDEELAQYAQPAATAKPATDDFNLDDLDALLKQGEAEAETAATTVKTTAETHEDFNFDFDVNELAQNNNLNLSSPAFDFPDVETVVEAPVATHLPQVEDVNFSDFEAEIIATPAPSSEFNLDLGAVALGAAGVAAASHLSQDEPQAAVNEGLTLSQDDINAINFDDFAPSNVAIETSAADAAIDIDALFQAEASTDEPQKEVVSKFNSISMDSGHELAFDDNFDLNFDELLSVDDASSTSTIVDDTPTFTPEEITFDTVVEAPVAEANPVVTAAVEESKPTQAWAGTGNFGNRIVEETAVVSAPAEPVIEQAFDLDFTTTSSTPAVTEAPTSEAAPFATDDIMSFDLDSLTAAPAQADSTAPTASTEVDGLSFDLDALNLDAPAATSPVAVVETAADDLSFDLDALNLDVPAVETTVVTAEAPADDLSFDLDALSLDTPVAEPAIQPAPTATPDSTHNFDFSLDELSADVSNTVATPAPEVVSELSLDDFNLDEFAAIETPAAVQTVAEVPAVPELDFSLDNLSLDTEPLVAEEVPAAVVSAADVTTAAVPDENLVLQTLQHTQDAKLDLAQMYIEIGDKDAAANILVDLMENGSNDAAERAQKLYQAL